MLIGCAGDAGPVGRPRDGLIDGWRGVSILLVLSAHFAGSRYGHVFPLVSLRDVFNAGIDPAVLFANVTVRVAGAWSLLGVNIFFCISGYIITALLLKEQTETGRVSIGAFYIRRFFRIVPPLAAFLIATWAFGRAGWIDVGGRDIAYASAFLCNMPFAACSWAVDHTWTLSVEEQFYIVWPALFVALGWQRQAPALAGIAILFGILFFLDVLPLRNGPCFSTIALGALYARSPAVRDWIARYISLPLVAASFLALSVRGFLVSMPPVIDSLDAATPALIAVLLFGSFHQPLLRRAISTAPLRWLGLISYSLYLWQEPFTGNQAFYTAPSFLQQPLLLFVVAAASFALIERPAIGVGRALSDKFVMQLKPAPP